MVFNFTILDTVRTSTLSLSFHAQRPYLCMGPKDLTSARLCLRSCQSWRPAARAGGGSGRRPRGARSPRRAAFPAAASLPLRAMPPRGLSPLQRAPLARHLPAARHLAQRCGPVHIRHGLIFSLLTLVGLVWKASVNGTDTGFSCFVPCCSRLQSLLICSLWRLDMTSANLASPPEAIAFI